MDSDLDTSIIIIISFYINSEIFVGTEGVEGRGGVQTSRLKRCCQLDHQGFGTVGGCSKERPPACFTNLITLKRSVVALKERQKIFLMSSTSASPNSVEYKQIIAEMFD